MRATPLLSPSFLLFLLSLVLPLLSVFPAAAADDAITRVEVSAPAPLQQRRDDGAGRIVVTRDELLRHGDATVADTLRRQPGVAVNGGQVQLRGMGGRTQFLIDGDPAPPGFSPDNLAPELIERVEILRSASADSGGQGIAGTINIVLRRTATRLRTAATLVNEHSAAGWSPGATLDISRPGEPWSGTLAAQVNRTRRATRTTVAEQTPAGERSTAERDDGVAERFALVPRLNWKSGDGATLAWNGLLDMSRGANAGNAHETASRGGASAYPRNGYSLDARTVIARSDIGGTRRLGGDARIEWKAGVAHNRREGDYRFTGRDQAGAALWRRHVLSTARDDSATSSGKVRFGAAGRHALTAGWDGTLSRRDETRRQQDSDMAGTPLGGLDQQYTARVRRLALYAQDEWSPAPTLDVSAGLRWEGLRTLTDGRDLADVTSRSGVWSPVAHLLWRVPGGRDQVRLALARTYKAPETRDLVPRRYTVNNGNGPTNPHVQGNPALRPELAWGIDAAYEMYFARAGMVSVAGYGRRIADVILSRLFQDGTDWVSSPRNGGRAGTHGIEVDGRLNVGPGVVARLTLARNWSRVEAVPGPDNRLGEQTPFTANAGLDYRLGPGTAAGFNWNVQAGGTSRTSLTQWSERGTLRRLDLYGSWQPRPGVTLRATATDLLDATTHNALRYADGDGVQRATREATGSGGRLLRLAAEFAL